MDLIIELLFILKQHTAFPQWKDHFSPTSKSYQLLHLIDIEDITDEHKLAQEIYGVAQNDKRFLMLKRNTLLKLQELLNENSVQIKKEEATFSQYNQLKKDLLKVEVLLIHNVYHNAQRILSKVYQQSTKTEYTDLRVTAARELCRVYMLKGYRDEFELWKKKLLTAQNLLMAERSLEICWEGLESHYKFFLTRNPVTHLEEIAIAVAQYESIPPACRSKTLELFYQRILVYKGYILEDILEMKRASAQCLDLIETNKFLYQDTLFIDSCYRYGQALNTLGQFTEAEKILESGLRKTSYQAFSKFLLMKALMLTYMLRGDYHRATQIVGEVTQTSQFEKLDVLDIEAWKIMALFLCFAQYKQDGKNYFNRLITSDAQLTKTLNQSITLAKDKKGYNALFLMIRTLWQREQKPELLDAQSNILQVYLTRHLKQTVNTRMVIFFKGLIKICKNNNATRLIDEVKSNAQSELKQLQRTHLYDTTEVLPYEQIFDWVD